MAVCAAIYRYTVVVVLPIFKSGKSIFTFGFFNNAFIEHQKINIILIQKLAGLRSCAGILLTALLLGTTSIEVALS